MELSAEERRAIVRYRIEKAEQTMVEAHDNAVLKHWNLVANRLYYALFHISSALLIAKGISVKTHSGTIRAIGQHFVITGLLDTEDGKLISTLQNMRHSGDYDDFFNWEEEQIICLFKPTEILIEKIKSLITFK